MVFINERSGEKREHGKQKLWRTPGDRIEKGNVVKNETAIKSLNIQGK